MLGRNPTGQGSIPCQRNLLEAVGACLEVRDKVGFDTYSSAKLNEDKMNGKPKNWDDVLEVAEEQFPKGKCAERGQMLVLLAYAKILLDDSNSAAYEEAAKVADNFPKHESAHKKMDEAGYGQCGLCKIATEIRKLSTNPKREL